METGKAHSSSAARWKAYDGLNLFPAFALLSSNGTHCQLPRVNASATKKSKAKAGRLKSVALKLPTRLMASGRRPSELFPTLEISTLRQ